MIVDYHTHSKYCRHAHGEIEEYIQRAVRLGLSEIGCSDHAPLPDGYDLKHRATPEEYYSMYAPAVEELADKYDGTIRVKKGIECDFLDWTNEWTREFIRSNDFDFVIGSVHFVGKKGSEKALFGSVFDQSEIEGLYEEYYHAIAASARCGLFDVIAHCDLVKKFGPCASKRIHELVWEALLQIKDSGLCIEINTSGLRRPERETYPSPRILGLAHDLRIPMTIGSDAHTPEDVGRDFDVASALLEKFADGNLSLFQKRQRSEVQISKLVV